MSSSAPVAQSYFTLNLQRDVVENYITEPEFRRIFLKGLEGPTAETPRVTVAELRKGEEFFKQDEVTIQAAIDARAPTGFEKINEEGVSYFLPLSDEPSQATCALAQATLDSGLAQIEQIIIGAVPFLGGLAGMLNTLLKTLTATFGSLIGGISAAALGAINVVLTSVLALLGTLSFVPQLSSIAQVLKLVQATITLYAKCATKPAASVFGLSAMSTFDLAHCGPLADIYRKAVTDSAGSAPKVADSASDEVKSLTSGSLSVLDLMAKSSIASKNEDLLATRPIFAASLLQRYREELLQQQLEDDWKLYAQADLSTIISLSNALEACLYVSADPAAAADDLMFEYE